jgi:beta-galactosidase GanA
MLAVGGSWPDSVRDTIKALGVTVQLRWQIEGYDEAPTLTVMQAEADAAQAVIAEQAAAEQAAITKEATMQVYRDVHSAHVVPVIDGDDLTVATLAEAFRAAANALEAI